MKGVEINPVRFGDRTYRPGKITQLTPMVRFGDRTYRPGKITQLTPMVRLGNRTIGVNLRKHRNYYDHFSGHMVIGFILSSVPPTCACGMWRD